MTRTILQTLFASHVGPWDIERSLNTGEFAAPLPTTDANIKNRKIHWWDFLANQPHLDFDSDFDFNIPRIKGLIPM